MNDNASNNVGCRDDMSSFLIHVPGMAALAMAAFLVSAYVAGEFHMMFMKPIDQSEEDMVAVSRMIVVGGTILASIVGAIIGIVLVPILTWLLHDVHPRSRPVAFILAISFIPTVVWAWLVTQLQYDFFAVSAAIPAVLCVVTLSAIYGVRYRRRNHPFLCPDCQYDLRHCSESGCPECGWEREDQPTTTSKAHVL